MTSTIQVEDSFDFEKEHIRVRVSRRISLGTEEKLTPELLTTLLKQQSPPFISTHGLEDFDFDLEEDKHQVRRHHKVIERITDIGSAILDNLPEVISAMEKLSDMVTDFVGRGGMWSYTTMGTMYPTQSLRQYSSCSWHSLSLDRDHEGVTVRVVVDLNSDSSVHPLQDGKLFNSADLLIFEEGSNLILAGDVFRDFHKK